MLNRNRLLNRNHRRRGAVLSIELLAVLPVLLLVIAASVEFGLLMTAHAAAADACHTAARLAALGVADDAALEQAARPALGGRMAAVAQMQRDDDPTTGIVTVRVSVPMPAAAPNLLWPIGYDLRGRFINASASMVAETH